MTNADKQQQHMHGIISIASMIIVYGEKSSKLALEVFGQSRISQHLLCLFSPPSGCIQTLLYSRLS